MSSVLPRLLAQFSVSGISLAHCAALFDKNESLHTGLGCQHQKATFSAPRRYFWRPGRFSAPRDAPPRPETVLKYESRAQSRTTANTPQRARRSVARTHHPPFLETILQPAADPGPPRWHPKTEPTPRSAPPQGDFLASRGSPTATKPGPEHPQQRLRTPPPLDIRRPGAVFWRLEAARPPPNRGRSTPSSAS